MYILIKKRVDEQKCYTYIIHDMYYMTYMYMYVYYICMHTTHIHVHVRLTIHDICHIYIYIYKSNVLYTYEGTSCNTRLFTYTRWCTCCVVHFVQFENCKIVIIFIFIFIFLKLKKMQKFLKGILYIQLHSLSALLLLLLWLFVSSSLDIFSVDGGAAASTYVFVASGASP